MAMAKANVPVDAFSPATVKEAASGDGGEGMGLRVLGFFLLFFFFVHGEDNGYVHEVAKCFIQKKLAGLVRIVARAGVQGLIHRIAF